MSKIVLACDQALRMSGYCIFKDNNPAIWDIISPTPKSSDIPIALKSIRRQFREVIKKYKPDTIILEIPMGGNDDSIDNHKTAFILAQVYGVLQELCAEELVNIEGIYASELQRICGIHKRDRASRKAGAVDFVKRKYGIIAPQDCVDAICIGYSWLEMNKPERSAF